MSTKLTSNGVSMVDSQSLKLIFAAANMNHQIAEMVSASLKNLGYKSATTGTLNFLSALECGENYASDIARSLGVSRQMVAKTVKQLCTIGYLQQVEGQGKQKRILFTELGEHLIADSRKLLAELDAVLESSVGQHKLSEVIEITHEIQRALQLDEKKRNSNA